jgi:hypothetical protein
MIFLGFVACGLTIGLMAGFITGFCLACHVHKEIKTTEE